jgi:hypothetical protein
MWRVSSSQQDSHRRCVWSERHDKSSVLAGSPYVVGLIAEKQGFVRSMSENGRGELRHEEEILQSETSDRDMATKIGEVVLVGLTDLLTMP